MKKIIIAFVLALNVVIFANEAQAQDVYVCTLDSGIEIYLQDETIKPDGSKGSTCMTKWIINRDSERLGLKKGDICPVRYYFYDLKSNGKYQYISEDLTGLLGGKSILQPIETNYAAQQVLATVHEIGKKESAERQKAYEAKKGR